MLIAIGIFTLSLLGILGLFIFKYVETERGIMLVPKLRVKADAQALRFKSFLAQGRYTLAALPPFLLHVMRIVIHEAALAAAQLARFLESQAHRLADFVSHKHRFEARETRSEFLKKVSEHKNNNGLDRIKQNGQNN